MAGAASFDALVDLAKGEGVGCPASEVIIRVDYDTLMRGYALEGEVCETVGFGPTTPEAIMELIDSADPVLRAVVTRGADVVGVAHIGRKPNAAQRTALRWLYLAARPVPVALQLGIDAPETGPAP